MRYLKIDGMLSGTGIRDSLTGEYLYPDDLGLSSELVSKFKAWVMDYESAHYRRFADEAENERLDRDGIQIARRAQLELPDVKIEYFSNARMQAIAFK